MVLKNHTKLEDLSLRQQNYIEAIAEVLEQQGHARTSDIARKLKVNKASVSEAISRLVEIGMVHRNGYEIEMTRRGVNVALELEHRHQTLRRFMVDTLEMDSAQADGAACRLEHSTSAALIDRLLVLENFMGQKDAANFKKAWRRFIKKHDVANRNGGD